MKKKICSPFNFYSLILITFMTIFQYQSYACTIPTVLTLNYTFTEATAGQTVEVTWASDCPAAMMNISLFNVDLWQTQQTYYNIPNTGSYMFTINSNLPLGQSGFYIEDVPQNIWNYGPYFELLGPLPVELINFNGDLEKDNSVQLNWSTASETNNSGFEIERSVNGLDWNTIHFVRGQGTSSEIKNYKFTDSYAKPGINYYRLKQIDFDGNFNYSPVIQLFVERIESGFRISPNPTVGDIQVFFNLPVVENLNVALFSLDGKLLISKYLQEGENKVTLDGSDLSPGIYFLQVSKNGQTLWAEKVVKQ